MDTDHARPNQPAIPRLGYDQLHSYPKYSLTELSSRRIPNGMARGTTSPFRTATGMQTPLQLFNLRAARIDEQFWVFLDDESNFPQDFYLRL